VTIVKGVDRVVGLGTAPTRHREELHALTPSAPNHV
jgi:hypothetical protein